MATPADEMVEEIRAKAREILSFAFITGPAQTTWEELSDDERDGFQVGVDAGMTATMVVLKEKGIIPGGPNL